MSLSPTLETKVIRNLLGSFIIIIIIIIQYKKLSYRRETQFLGSHSLNTALVQLYKMATHLKIFER